MPTVNPQPHVYVEMEIRGQECRAWLLIDDEYREITAIVSAFDVKASVGDVSTVTLTFPYAKSGRPPA